MSMVEPNNCLDMIANGIPEDEEFDNILNILDFPMESLEDDAFVSDWDISKSHCLGPIPTNVLMGNSTIPDVKAKNGPTYLSNELVVPIVGAEDQKRPSNLVSASGPPHTVRSNESVEAQESSVFQTQSPVSVLESSGSCSATKNTVPMRARSKRLKGTGPNPWLSASSYFTTKRSSLPRKDKDTNKKKKKKSSVEVEGSGLAPNHPGPQTHRPTVAKRCMHCEVTKTPQWREGPLGPKTLCNACGVRYRSGRLFPEYRPAASPTFVPTHHSNSHKKVIEMRNKGKETEQKANDEPLVSSPPPEFVPMNKYDTCVSDRDISKSHCLGPIPSDVLMSPPTIPDRKVETGPTYLSNELVVPIVEAQDQNQPSNLVAATGPRALQSNESIEAQELSVFQTQSPVSVLDSSGPSSAPKNVPNTIPVQARPKRVKGTGPNPWLSSYLTKRISLPREDKDTKKKKKKSSDGVENYPGPQIHHPPVARKCTHCEVTETPQWREGPLGPKTLCNACGMRYRSGRLLPEYRPAVSPTFISARHSNSHKKVIEMRNTRRSSPPPEFVPMSNYLFDYIY